MQDVAVLHHVVLAFDAQLPGFLDGGFRTVFDEVVEIIGLGADETFFEVGMNLTRRLRLARLGMAGSPASS